VKYTKKSDESVCKAKECNDQTPFSNGSCSLKEDFSGEGRILFIKRNEKYI
jgi:hypothetical protein